MYKYDENKRKIIVTNGGYENQVLPIRDTYVDLGRGLKGILYEPLLRSAKSRIGVIIVHSDEDYSTMPMGAELSRRGYTVFAGQVRKKDSTLDDKMLDINCVMGFLRNFTGIEKIILMGHSGGATLMTAYQNAAENGVRVFSGDDKIIKCSIVGKLLPADGIMTIDANFGNGAMTLFSVDPAIVEESGCKIDPELDIFSEANGYDPEGACYNEAFLKKFFKAQACRNNKLIKKALERLYALESGKSFYVDDEPFIVTGGAQIGPCNKLIRQDIHLLAHTKKTYDLIHGDGSVTNEIIYSVRKPFGGYNPTRSIEGVLRTTVKNFLSERAVPAADDYCIREDGVQGVEWMKSYDCPPANIIGIHVPLLCVGLTAGYEFLAAEEIYQNATSEDKTIVFIEGASHMVDPEKGNETFPGQFGDTHKTLYDFMDKWMDEKGRFDN